MISRSQPPPKTDFFRHGGVSISSFFAQIFDFLPPMLTRCWPYVDFMLAIFMTFLCHVWWHSAFPSDLPLYFSTRMWITTASPMVARVFAVCHIFIAKHRDESLTMWFLPEFNHRICMPDSQWMSSECHRSSPSLARSLYRENEVFCQPIATRWYSITYRGAVTPPRFTWKKL